MKQQGSHGGVALLEKFRGATVPERDSGRSCHRHGGKLLLSSCRLLLVGIVATITERLLNVPDTVSSARHSEKRTAIRFQQV